jgi:glycosyltransferase involved in cell wall biosynthesis
MSGRGSNYLQRLLDSISRQTFKNFEVVVSDHAIGDENRIVCEAYRQIIALKYFRNESDRGSSSSNLNSAIKHATGEWIKPVFQDDFFLTSSALAQIVDFLEAKPTVGWFATGSIQMFEGGALANPFIPFWSKELYLGKNTISSPSVIGFNEKYKHILFSKELIWLMDIDFYLNLSEEAGVPEVLPQILVVNSVWSGSVSNVTSDSLKEAEKNKFLAKFSKKMTRTDILNMLIRRYKYSSYLEIGVNTQAQPGYNWEGVDVLLKHGVDPNVDTTYKMTSDDFFETHVSQKYDLIFIDGLHLYEQAYRDIQNALRFLTERGTIVVHDCIPHSEVTQRRIRDSDAWHGDVWKAVVNLRFSDPTLDISTVDTDEGCAIIRRGKQTVLTVPPELDIFDYKTFEQNKNLMLNIISTDAFVKKYLS